MDGQFLWGIPCFEGSFSSGDEALAHFHDEKCDLKEHPRKTALYRLTKVAEINSDEEVIPGDGPSSGSKDQYVVSFAEPIVHFDNVQQLGQQVEGLNAQIANLQNALNQTYLETQQLLDKKDKEYKALQEINKEGKFKQQAVEWKNKHNDLAEKMEELKVHLRKIHEAWSHAQDAVMSLSQENEADLNDCSTEEGSQEEERSREESSEDRASPQQLENIKLHGDNECLTRVNEHPRKSAAQITPGEGTPRDDEITTPPDSPDNKKFQPPPRIDLGKIDLTVTDSPVRATSRRHYVPNHKIGGADGVTGDSADGVTGDGAVADGGSRDKSDATMRTPREEMQTPMERPVSPGNWETPTGTMTPPGTP